MTLEIRPLTEADVPRLAQILEATVASGGSVHFMDPVPPGAAAAYWSGAVADPGRIVLGAFADGTLQGTVTLWLDTPPNQPFRGEIWKLMVHPDARGQGLARALMREAEQLAAKHGRTLLNLDTATEGGASELYESLGWTRAGVIPDYAYKPQGGLVGTAIYYKAVG
ncbi:GNAT family N-acetyltransferase [Phenylobacterium kunshanense]|uniref:GNAT family N-acetyltransferase n=1 Tax=Phenylobacterium kunshanense TaxID=1445034 RepID=A0A328B9Z7_9CAUL|nr:GNAT family N-acetyltransferase [Phenylobacterium kunshanense]RAK63281.1 GNAT family N-acetyltransferase [Phenylobacterium kunshanense]